MQLDFTQRWDQRRSRWIAHRATLDPERFTVRVIREDLAHGFCEVDHYAGSLGAVRLPVGLFERGGAGDEQLVGACVFGVLLQPRAAERWCGQDAGVVPELHRLCLLDRAPFNAESFFVARAIRLLRERMPKARALLSYADPVPRYDAGGQVTKFGHVGTCYQALSMRFTGTSSARTLIVDREGRVLSERSLSKLRNGERGARYAERQLIDSGAPSRRPLEEPRAYVARALREGPFRQFRHPGNLVYALALDDSADTRARLAPARPYLTRAELGLSPQGLRAEPSAECAGA